MVKALHMDTLLAAAARVGVVLSPTTEPGDLYAWATPQREVVYLGKSDSPTRVRDEEGWRHLDPSAEIVSGIVLLLRVNHAHCEAFTYDPATFDPTRWQAIVAAGDWGGSAVERLWERLLAGPPTVAEVEELLIRIAVRYGTPLGNSQYHSQWENPIDRPADTLAVLAVDSDPGFTVPPPLT